MFRDLYNSCLEHFYQQRGKETEGKIIYSLKLSFIAVTNFSLECAVNIKTMQSGTSDVKCSYCVVLSQSSVVLSHSYCVALY